MRLDAGAVDQRRKYVTEEHLSSTEGKSVEQGRGEAIEYMEDKAEEKQLIMKRETRVEQGTESRV